MAPRRNQKRESSGTINTTQSRAVLWTPRRHHPLQKRLPSQKGWDRIGGEMYTRAEIKRRYRARRYREIEDLPRVPCACGCGKKIPPIGRSLKPAKYAHGHNPDGKSTQFRKGQAAWNKGRAGPSGSNSPTWKGGEWRSNGHVRCTITPKEASNHPTALNHGSPNYWSIQRSHLVWNRAHPDNLVRPGQHIHHINRIKDDDRIKNLRKMGHSAHLAMHRKAEPKSRNSLGGFC